MKPWIHYRPATGKEAACGCRADTAIMTDNMERITCPDCLDATVFNEARQNIWNWIVVPVSGLPVYGQSPGFKVQADAEWAAYKAGSFVFAYIVRADGKFGCYLSGLIDKEWKRCAWYKVLKADKDTDT